MSGTDVVDIARALWGLFGALLTPTHVWAY